MIITRLSGGMGNQMFQYAMGRSLSLKYNQQLKLDNWMQQYLNRNGFFNYLSVFRGYDLDVFTIKASIAQQSDIPLWLRSYSLGKLMPILDGLRRRLIHHKGREVGYRYDVTKMDAGLNVYIDGDWQSYKYFEAYADEIRKDFTIKSELPKNVRQLQIEIQDCNSLCIHVRRGDYVGNAFHEVVTKEYYVRALNIVKEKTNIDHIYVFSDDIAWCEKELTFGTPTTFVGNEYAGEHAIGHFALMRSCKHFIIPNSSFSWWAAWLGECNQKIVVAPKQWFADDSIHTTDLIPEEWMRI